MSSFFWDSVPSPPCSGGEGKGRSGRAWQAAGGSPDPSYHNLDTGGTWTQSTAASASARIEKTYSFPRSTKFIEIRLAGEFRARVFSPSQDPNVVLPFPPSAFACYAFAGEPDPNLGVGPGAFFRYLWQGGGVTDQYYQGAILTPSVETMGIGRYTIDLGGTSFPVGWEPDGGGWWRLSSEFVIRFQKMDGTWFREKNGLPPVPAGSPSWPDSIEWVDEGVTLVLAAGGEQAMELELEFVDSWDGSVRGCWGGGWRVGRI